VTQEEFARWHRAGSLLARLPASVTGGLLPQRLLDDLASAARGDAAHGTCLLRIVVLWAAAARDGQFIEALFAARLPGFEPGRPAGGQLPLRITPQEGPPRLVHDQSGHSWPALEIRPGQRAAWRYAAPVTVIVLPVVSPYGQAGPGFSMAAAIRGELAGAHAVLGVVGFEDITGSGTSAGPAGWRLAHLDHLAEWLSFALDCAGTERVTIAVDGVGGARADPGVVRDLVRQRARVRLCLPSSWPTDAIISADSGLALAGGYRADENWAASGLPELLHRISDPLAADPMLIFMSTAAREFRDACVKISHRSAEILAAGTTAGDQRHPCPGNAAHRRARLAAIAAGPIAARALEGRPLASRGG